EETRRGRLVHGEASPELCDAELAGRRGEQLQDPGGAGDGLDLAVRVAVLVPVAVGTVTHRAPGCARRDDRPGWARRQIGRRALGHIAMRADDQYVKSEANSGHHGERS